MSAFLVICRTLCETAVVLLSEVLALPVMLRAKPKVLVAPRVDATVRWVHSSEIYEIAPLLRGGELLLTTGLGLEDRDPAALVAYVDGLAAAHVAGLAIELGRSLPEVPPAVLGAAQARQLPLIALTDIVPFVEITAAADEQIVHAEVEMLRRADQIGRALTESLAVDGGELTSLVDTLAATVGCEVRLQTLDGGELAASAPQAVDSTVDTAVIGLPVRGVSVAQLHLFGASARTVEAVSARAPSVFAVALLRSGDLVGRASEMHRLVESARSGHEDTAGIGQMLRRSGLVAGARDCWLVVATDPVTVRALLDTARDAGWVAATVSVPAEGGCVAVLGAKGVEQPAKAVVQARALAMRALSGYPSARASIGAAVTSTAELGTSIRSALSTYRLLARTSGSTPAVAQVRCAWELPEANLLAELGVSLTDLLGDPLSALRGQGAAPPDSLLHTLQAFYDCAENRTMTAQRLGIRRNSLYQRLDRIERLLGVAADDAQLRPMLRLSSRLTR